MCVECSDEGAGAQERGYRLGGNAMFNLAMPLLTELWVFFGVVLQICRSIRSLGRGRGGFEGFFLDGGWDGW